MYFKIRTVIEAVSSSARVLCVICAVGMGVGTLAQNRQQPAKSLEVSEGDGIPVLVKHLPDWEAVQTRSTFIKNGSELRSALGERPVLDMVDFTPGTEAVTAPYPAGRLLIIEYISPQLSIESDNNVKNFLARDGDGHTFYKRTGNYNIFVFDASDEASANALIGKVQYEKNIQWLGDDPFLFHKMERAFVNQTTDLFFSTVEVIALGIGLSIVGGLIVGYVFFLIRERQRQTFSEFSDAGGMTRLNLDGLTPEMTPNRLLNE